MENKVFLPHVAALQSIEPYRPPSLGASGQPWQAFEGNIPIMFNDAETEESAKVLEVRNVQGLQVLSLKRSLRR